MALAEQQLAHAFNRGEHAIVDHRTFVFCGDGCLMEGISHEACSFAGTMELEKLIVFYDDNGISIDGHVEGWFNDDTAKRFEAYGWRVIRGVDGMDSEAVAAAVAEAVTPCGRPTLVMLQDGDRLWRAEAGRHPRSRTARRWARPRSRRPGRRWAGTIRRSRSRRDQRRLGRARRRRQARRRRGRRNSPPMPRRSRPRPRSSAAASPARLPADFAAKADAAIAEAAAVTDPSPPARRRRTRSPRLRRSCRSSSADRRT